MTPDAMRWSPEPDPVVDPVLRIDVTAFADDPDGARRHIEDTLGRHLRTTVDDLVTGLQVQLPDPPVVDYEAVLAAAFELAYAADHTTVLSDGATYTPIARIEAHPTTIELLKQASARPVPRPWLNGALWDPFGTPIVVDEDLAVGAWRALDRDGRVLHESPGTNV